MAVASKKRILTSKEHFPLSNITSALPSVDGPLDPSLRCRDVEFAIGYSERQIRRMVRKGTFPAPVRGTGPFVVWPASAVAAWLASKAGV